MSAVALLQDNAIVTRTNDDTRSLCYQSINAFSVYTSIRLKNDGNQNMIPDVLDFSCKSLLYRRSIRNDTGRRVHREAGCDREGGRRRALTVITSASVVVARRLFKIDSN